jgi:acetyl esterase/lipase
VLISPWLDLSCSVAARTAVAGGDPWLALPGLAEAGRCWAGESGVDAPALNPLRRPLSGIGDLTVYAGTRDVLFGEAQELRERARAAGVKTNWHEGAAMIHAWPLLPTVQGRAERAAICSRLAQQARSGTA